VITRNPQRFAAGDVPVLVASFVSQIALAAALRVVPVRLLSQVVARSRSHVHRLITAPDDRLVWAIEGVGRRLPWVSTCLVRALAADLLLDGAAEMRRVRVGVKRGSNGALESHAWFERDGQILVGRAGAADYTPFMILE
jgi:hypothetical protein